MNNPRSMLLGWGGLIVAGGVSYYFVKRGINERRKMQQPIGARPTEQSDWSARTENQNQASTVSMPPVTDVGVADGDPVAVISPPGTQLAKKNGSS